MSEWKPFLEVVNVMKNEDIADCEKSYVSSLIKHNNEVYKYDTKRNEIGDLMTIHDSWFKHNFKIRPRYVNYQDAFKAISEGKYVDWHIDDTVIPLNNKYYLDKVVKFYMVRNDDKLLRFEDLLNGKFIIKD